MSNLPRGIYYVSDNDLSWTRKKHKNNHFSFFNKNLKKIINPVKLLRLKKLAIPPAWAQVKICPDDKGHIQAVGFDDKGRKQYIYHPAWIKYNQQHKFDNLVLFGQILPKLRDTVSAHMRQHNLSKQRILATITWLLENTFIRVGNKAYEQANQSYGLTTLRNKHTKITGNKINFTFKGKSGVYHQLDISHPRVAQTIKQCIELPGYEIFQYLDDDGQKHRVDSRDVNDYLKEITGQDLSAKDFRTWGGTTKAADFLFQLEEPEKDHEQDLIKATQHVAEQLGNTVAVCKKYYIHPKVFDAYKKNQLIKHFKRAKENFKKNQNQLLEHEYAIWTLIRNK